MKRVHCEGAPRDLGLDQGVALRDEIRAAVGAESWWGRLIALRGDSGTTRLHRDLCRYFPHQAESLDGMARGAGVPVRALVRSLAGSAAPGSPTPRALAVSADAGVRIAIAAPPRAVVREAQPEGRFASVEVTRVTATAPSVGVNEAGLAIAVVPRPIVAGRFAVPVSLFARDCLERFESVEPALEWCLSRPAAIGGALLLADASGALVGIDASAPTRRALGATAGWLAIGAAGEAGPNRPKVEEIADPRDLESALVATLSSVAPLGGASVLIDPVGRGLRVAGEAWIRPRTTQS